MHPAILAASILSASVSLGAQAFFADHGRLDHLPVGERNVIDAVAAGDFDGDGRDDVAWLQDDAVVVLRGVAGGRFDTLARFPVAVRSGFGGIVAMDLDGDPRPDLVYATDAGVGGWLEWSATGLVHTPLAGFPSDVLELAAGDVDGDGDDDLFVARGSIVGSGTRSLLLRNDAGTLTNVTAGALPFHAQNIGAIALFDADSDGDLDAFLGALVSFGGPNPNNALWRNDGTGRFTADPSALRADRISVHDVAVADFDGDGDLDLAVAQAGGDPAPWNRVAYIYRNDGATFQLLFDAVPPEPRRPNAAVAFAELDGDGLPDLLIGVRGDGVSGITELVGDGVGGFAVRGVGAAGSPARRLVVADFSGDGRDDVLVAPGGIGFVTSRFRARLLFGDPAASRDVTAPRPFGVPPTRFRPRMVAADVDGDGAADLVQHRGDGVADLGLFLNDGDGPVRDVSATHVPPLGGAAFDLGSVDLDGDARRDIWVTRQIGGSESLRLLRADPGGVLRALPAADHPPTRGASVELRAADLDADGIDELIVRDAFGLEVWQRTGLLRWQVDPRTGALARALYDFDIGDVDGDGVVELVAKPGGASPIDRLVVWGIVPGGTFALESIVALPMIASFGGDDVRLGDADGDGDLDIFVLASVPALLLNDGRGNFVAAAAARFPLAAAQVRRDQVIDVDLDGDLDVVGAAASFGRGGDVLLINDGAGWFTDRGDELGAGYADVYADADGDGDLDAWVSDDVFGVLVGVNLRRQIHAPWVPTRGDPMRLTLHGRAPGGDDLVLAGLSLATARLPVPPLGVVRVDPATWIGFGLLAIPAATGTVDLGWTTPSDPNLIGLVLHAQAVHLGASGAPPATWRLGNHVELPAVR